MIGVVRAYGGSIDYITAPQLEHALQGHEQRELGNPDKGDLANLILRLLKRKPDYTDGNRQVYKIKYNGRDIDLAIAIDQQTGMMTTSFSVYKR